MLTDCIPRALRPAEPNTRVSDHLTPLLPSRPTRSARALTETHTRRAAENGAIKHWSQSSQPMIPEGEAHFIRWR